MTDQEREAQENLEAMIAKLDDLEREWLSLPEDVRRSHQELAAWFAASPVNRHRKAGKA